MKKSVLSILFFLALLPNLLASPKIAAAQAESPQPILCDSKDAINTAIGCIPITDTNAFLGFILGWAVGIGGGIAFLLIIVAGFQIMSSSGNPDRLKAGQELMTSAIAGLIMLIFSIFILRLIGIDILGLSSLGFPISKVSGK